MRKVGVVAIGRNEGERLRRCLESARHRTSKVVYVDSGSTDGSVEMARAMGVEVVELDMSTPFTAARARNAGFERLAMIWPDVAHVQFIDGDCEISDGWLEAASRELESVPELAIVGGRCRERFRDASIYNRLCDVEWDTPVGEAESCGGNAMVRAKAFRAVGGYDPTVIAGEEPEMCVRLRQKGWRIFRVGSEMVLHDAAMTRFGQWWKRTVRAGHSFAEGAAMHGHSPQRHCVRQTRSNWFWGLGLPLVSLGLAVPTRGLSLILLGGYAVLAWKVRRHMLRRGFPTSDATVYAAFTAVGKFPQALGQMKYWLNRLTGRRTRIIEYKTADTTARSAARAPSA